jgi:hypothetical protein
MKPAFSYATPWVGEMNVVSKSASSCMSLASCHLCFVLLVSEIELPAKLNADFMRRATQEGRDVVSRRKIIARKLFLHAVLMACKSFTRDFELRDFAATEGLEFG